MKELRWFEWPIHTFLLALYAPLDLLAVNSTQLRATDSARAVVLSLLLALVVLVGMRALYGTWSRAGVASSFFLVFFFSYGHLYEWARHLTPGAILFIRHRFLLPVLTIALLLGLWRLRGKSESYRSLAMSLNLVTALLLVVPVFSVGKSEWRYMQAGSEKVENPTAGCLAGAALPSDPPDIYYIVLDAYARRDVLQSTYNYDNEWFLDGLRSRGFYVADESQSNYARTGLSLNSSLNMDYLPSEGEPSAGAYWPTIGSSRVRRAMECLGYTVVAFDSGYYWSGWRDADYFLTPTDRSGSLLSLTGMNAFEALLTDSTLLRVVTDAGEVVPSLLRPDVQGPLREHYIRVNFAFDQLSGGVTNLPSPKFVFAHIVSPHRPFVFDREGNFLPTSPRFTFMDPNEQELTVSELAAYPEQVEYVSKRTLQAVDNILGSTGGNAIILVQGDHGIGRGVYDRMSNLSAYFLPDGKSHVLYPTITPVNSFRIVLDEFFDARLPLLEDVSYFSTPDHLYDFEIVPNPATDK